MESYIVDFEPVGRRGQCQADESLLACARRLGVGIVSLCGGQGTCRTCRVQVMSGAVSEPTATEKEAFPAEELAEGWRLACQAYPLSDCKLSIPSESMPTPQRTQVEGLEIAVSPEPPVTGYNLELEAPSLSEPQADADRLLKALASQHSVQCQTVDIGVVRAMSPRLRAWKWHCRASARHDEVVAVGPTGSRQLGIAVDLGTTKIAGYLIDLSDGKTLTAKGMMNPQISYGEDIISRINASIKSPAIGAELQQAAVGALNELSQELCGEAEADAEQIVEAVVVANTAMHHLFLGLPVRQLVLAPFVPAIGSAVDVKARDLGAKVAPGAYVHLLPNIAGFVGADHVAMLLATGAYGSKGPLVAIDIGTNTEVSLIVDGRITTVSCASGPAFEGYQIKHGMRAASGAIERVRIADGEVQYQTIDDQEPVGICGSGVLDALAQMHLNGIIDQGGRMKDGHPRMGSASGKRQFVLAEGRKEGGRSAIVITQKDVREIQLAKAAIRSGIQVLLEANGVAEPEIAQVVIAGAFGSYIDLPSAITIGMLPSIPLDRFRQVGNAAGMGAKQALISLSKRDEAQRLATRVEYIELASAPYFTDTFVQANYLGRYRLEKGKREAADGD
ncbi:MAG: ASKHA domain-containing protein [Chloroflexota bacterium]|nr:ASKHA domain-containing protein [Chloroflexota bacterium]